MDTGESAKPARKQRMTRVRRIDDSEKGGEGKGRMPRTQISSLCLPACSQSVLGVQVGPVISTRAWLQPAQLAAFNAAQTTAHRLCSIPDGWVERLGDD